MLPRAARLRRAQDFRTTLRGGVRVARSTLVLHAGRTSPATGVRVGLVVSKSVGPAVRRNRVKRRIRHLAAACLPTTPPGTNIVVRALPRAAAAPAELRVDLPAAWSTALRRLEQA